MQNNNNVNSSPVENSTSNWKLLFSSLLKTKVQDLDFEIKETDNQILIETADEKQALQLKRILRSPEAVITSVDYTIVEENTSAHNIESKIEEPHYPEPMAFEHDNGDQIYPKTAAFLAISKVL